MSADTQAQFQQWLKAKYRTLDNLNTRWTTAYWSETYQDWDADSDRRNATEIPGCS